MKTRLPLLFKDGILVDDSLRRVTLTLKTATVDRRNLMSHSDTVISEKRTFVLHDVVDGQTARGAIERSR
jgi:hypothetical protein